MASASSPPSPKLYDVDITIVSAKHLKNINWRHGDLKAYVVFYVDPGCRLSTKTDDSGSTQPVWNERFVLPLTLPPQVSLLTVEIFHSNPSDTPKPLVGTLKLPLQYLVDWDDYSKLRIFELRRPSGRPQGKIRLKLAIRECPTPPPSYYSAPRDDTGYSPYTYSSHPPPSTYQSRHGPYGGYSDQWSGYYPGYYSQLPPLPRPLFELQSNYGGAGPSAPVDYSSYDQKQGGKMGLGDGLAVGAVAGSLGGLSMEDGLKREEQKIAVNVENDIAARDNYSDNHHANY